MIDENLVRGGIDEEEEHSFPWITRLTLTGIKFVEEKYQRISENKQSSSTNFK